MRFYLKRYGTALHTHKKWALLALLPFALYLIFAALDDVTFSVSQDFSAYSGTIPVAASDSAIATVSLDDVVADPDLLFLDGFALMQLQKKLGLLERHAVPVDDSDLRRAVHSALSLSAAGDSKLRLSYAGKDPGLGRMLVGFYTNRLLKRIQDGVARTKARVVQGPPTVQPTGDLVVIGKRSMWSADRLLPATVTLLLSSLGVMVLIAFFELSDRSFKSERQMARYLGIPVLGAIPDAGPLVRALPE